MTRRALVEETARSPSPHPVNTAIEGWGRRKLGECAGQRTEKVTPTTVDTRPYVALEHLAQGRPALLGWSSAGSATSAKTVFFAGDVLFGKLRPNLKKAATARFDGVCSTDILPLFGKEGLDSAFLLQLAHWERFQQHAVATASGTKMPRTSWKQLGDFTFLCPPPSEQRKIAAVLSSVDDAIEKTQAAVDQVRIAKRGVMRELFTRGLPGRHRRFKRTELGELPEEWMAMTLADAATVVGGGTPSRAQSIYWNGEVPWATPTDVTALSGRTISETASYVTETGLANSSATLLSPNSLLMTTRATIGACAINRVAMATNQGFQSLVPKRETCVVDFLYYLVQYHGRRLEQLAAGSTFREVSKRAVRGFRVHLPRLSEQRRIASVLSSMDDTAEKSRRLIDGLQIVKRGLLSALLTGEIRVRADTEAA